MVKSREIFDQDDGGFSGGTRDTSDYGDMDREAKRLAQFLKSDRRFHCKLQGSTTKPSECAKTDELACCGCHYRAVAQTIFKRHQKEKPSDLMDDLQKEASKMGVTKEKKAVTDTINEAPTSVEASIDKHEFNFQRYNPGAVSKSWKPVCAGVTLKQSVLYLNTEAVRQFELGKYRFVILAFDPDKNALLLEFSEENTDRQQLSVTHRNGGDAKVGIIGFRKYYDITVQGRFRVAQFDKENAEMLTFLDDETREE